MQGSSSWLWRFNPLLLRLHRDISLSILCSHSSWVSALDLALPLHVGCSLGSVLHPDRRGLKEQLIRGLWLTQARGREGYGGYNWNAGRACGGRGRCDVATAWGTPHVFSQGSCLWITGPWQWQAAQAPRRGGVDSDLCLHTGFLVAAAAAFVFHVPLWCLCW